LIGLEIDFELISTYIHPCAEHIVSESPEFSFWYEVHVTV